MRLSGSTLIQYDQCLYINRNVDTETDGHRGKPTWTQGEGLGKMATGIAVTLPSQGGPWGYQKDSSLQVSEEPGPN